MTVTTNYLVTGNGITGSTANAVQALVSDAGIFGPTAAAAPVGGATDWTLLTLAAGITSGDAAVRVNGNRYEFCGTLTGAITAGLALASLPVALPPPGASTGACSASTGPATVTISADGRLSAGTVSGSPTSISLDGVSAPVPALQEAAPNVRPTLAVVRLETLGQTIPAPTLDTYISGFITVEANSSGLPDMARQPIDISGHGNSTWGRPKKPYKLRFPTAQPLLGMPAVRHWRALANYYDRTLIRNAVAFEAMRRVYSPWTPRNEYAELYIDGVYQGVYAMTESIRADANRLPVTLAPSSGTGLAATGAFMLEVNSQYVAEGENGFSTVPSGVPIQFDDPSAPPSGQVTYLTNWVNTFDATLMGGSWLDPVNGYAKYVDMNSWADWYLISEVTRNQDSTFYASCKLYKTRDTDTTPGKLYFGPLWDSDLSLGNGYNATANALRDWSGAHNLWYTRTSVWFKRMTADPAFATVVQARWALFKAALSGPYGVMEWARNLALKISAAADADGRRWGYTADSRIRTQLMLRWLRRRIDWLDGRIANLTVVNINPYGRGSLGATPSLYTINGGAATLALQAGNPLAGGGNSLRATWTTASTSSSGIVLYYLPVSENQPYSVAAAVRGSVNKSMQLRAQFYDSANAPLGTQIILDPFTISANTLTTLPTLQAVAPAGATRMAVNVYTQIGVGWAVGEWLEVCGLMVVQVHINEMQYADPLTNPGSGWVWDGTALASTSRGWPL